MESWDDENFEPRELAATISIASNKWEGEDEDEDVKDNWEDEEEEKEKEKEKEEKIETVKSKPKKLQDKIAEKERLQKEEYERRMKEQQEEEEEEISPEEKIRRQKESDLKAALETTFDGSETNNIVSGIDNYNPSSKEEFQEFTDMLIRKIQPLMRHPDYPTFAENFTRSLCAPLSSFDIKKIKNTIDNLYLEKQKIEKGEKVKKNKGKGKAKLKLEDDNQYSAYVDDYNDYDDFM